MKLFVTVAETAADDALAAIRNIQSGHDGIEVRAEHFAGADPSVFREATAKPLLYTIRGRGPIDLPAIRRALDAGFDLVDVEWSPDLEPATLASVRDRIVISHHDYEAMKDVEAIVASMRRIGCRHVKLAATPRSMDDNRRLLALSGDGVSVIGMGEQGLFTRILAPFRGSELTFVAPDEAHVAAPGQLTLDRALAIFGDERETLSAAHVFAVVGNPAVHSRSPLLHNPMFRSRGVRAAYTVASVPAFSEVSPLLASGELAGVSVTAPFKEDALAWGEANGLAIAENARLCGAANTVAMRRSRLVDNTDVDGFIALLRRVCGRERKTAAIIGAGGTARAALLACRRLELDAVVFNRTRGRADVLVSQLGGRACDLGDLAAFDGEIIIDTTPAGPDSALTFKAGMTYLRAAYGSPSRHEEDARRAGADVITGLDLLEAQAIRQNELFVQAIHDQR